MDAAARAVGMQLKGIKMIDNVDSEILECIRVIIESSGKAPRDVAYSVSMTKQELYSFLHECKGTQLAKAEKILDALGYELVIRKKRGENI